MKGWPKEILSQLKQANQQYYWCFHFHQFNGKAEQFLTEHDQNIKIDDKLFYAQEGVKFNYMNFSDSGINEAELEILDANIICPGQKCSLFLFLEDHLLYFSKFVISKIVNKDIYYIVHLENHNIVKLQKPLLEAYSQKCRANFGDSRCKINKFTYGEEVVVSKITANNIEIEGSSQIDGYYDNGAVWLNKDDEFSQAAIIKHNNNYLNLTRRISSKINIGDSIFITAGCDKKFNTCCNKFDNALNFRGEPFVPVNRVLKPKT